MSHDLFIFIDESGDFGPYEPHAPFYIVSLVFHDQGHDIAKDIAALRRYIARSELEFFGGVRDLKKNFLNPAKRKKLASPLPKRI